MLVNLHVKNLAIIDEVEVDFSENMNVLTGETGAGKSIIIGSVNLALGGKFTGDMIRTGADQALVELLFTVDRPEQREALEALGVTVDGEDVLISRKLMQKRSVCRVNGETVTQSLIKKIAGILIDIHGQNEQQSLLHMSKHMEILDRYGKEKLAQALQEFGEHYRNYRNIQAELEEGQIPEEERLREISFLQYELQEITEAKLREGEEEELEENYQRLSHASAIAEGLGEACRLTATDSGAASDQIGEALRHLHKIAEYDESVQGFADQLSEIDSLLGDFNRDVSGYMEDFECDPQEQMQVEKRLDQIRSLQAKYGSTVEAVEEYAANVAEPMRPIGTAASGGELSRIMLAVKAVLAEHDEISTLIFDEIDVGISGRTAQKVAEKMALIGGCHQVICISHLAQIAAMADTHYLIEKNNEDAHTATTIYALDEEQSVQELARILGGAQITDAVMDSAREMRELAIHKKAEIRQSIS